MISIYGIISVLNFIYGGTVDNKTIEIENISPKLLLCHRLCDSAQKRIYHPERKSRNYEIILVQDKPDIHIINSKEYFVYPEDVIFIKPGDVVSSYSYGTNLNLVFDIYKYQNGVFACDYLNSFDTHYIIKDSNKDEYSKVIQEIFDCFEADMSEIISKAKSLIIYLIYIICRDNKRDDDCIAKSIRYIDKNIESKLLIEQLAKEAELSKTHFHRLFKEAYGITPIEYINRKKMKIARELLKKNEMKVVEISHKLGFESVSYFGDLFKQTYGFSPKSYRNNFTNL